MSTHCNVGTPDGDDYLVTYVHSDGYPSGVGRDLFEAVTQHPRGVDVAVERFSKLIRGRVGKLGISMIAHRSFLVKPVLVSWDFQRDWSGPAIDREDYMACWGGNLRIYNRPLDLKEKFDWRAKGSELKAKNQEEYYTYIVSPGGLLAIIGGTPTLIRWDEAPDWVKLEEEAAA